MGRPGGLRGLLRRPDGSGRVDRPEPEADDFSTTSRRTLRRAARRAGWELDDASIAFLRRLEVVLRRGEQPTVGVLVDDPSDRLADLLTATFPSARVDELHVSAGDPSLHLRLAAAGPFDLVVDATVDVPERGTLLHQVLLHVRHGGVLLVRDAVEDRDASATGEDPESLPAVVAALVRGRLSSPHEEATRAQDAADALASSVRSLEVEARHLVVASRSRALVKVREAEIDEILRLRDGRGGRVLHTCAGQAFESRAVVHESQPSIADRRPETYEAPALALRSYDDVVSLPGQVVVQGNLLLPDTFRHNQRAKLGNRHTRDVLPDFGTPRGNLRGARRLEGSYFHLDSEFGGHFGHAITEQLSRLWAWQEAKQAEPGLKALMTRKRGRELKPFEAELYAAAGVDLDDLVLANGPVRVDRLLAATPMLSQPDYIHPGIAEVWRTVSDNLAARAPERDYPARFFCARALDKRPCHNAPEVEALFAEHGFEILYPERYSLPEQAMLFRSAEVVAGFAGSALFNLCLSGSAKREVLIRSESYIAENEYMIAAVLGHELDIAWCRPDVEAPGLRFQREAFHSGFRFDFAREGEFVREVLEQL